MSLIEKKNNKNPERRQAKNVPKAGRLPKPAVRCGGQKKAKTGWCFGAKKTESCVPSRLYDEG